MSFSACVSLGDWQLENQPDWGKEYPTALEAQHQADKLYEWAYAVYLPRQTGPCSWMNTPEGRQTVNAYAWENVPGEGFCLDDDKQIFYWRGYPQSKVDEDNV